MSEDWLVRSWLLRYPVPPPRRQPPLLSSNITVSQLLLLLQRECLRTARHRTTNDDSLSAALALIYSTRLGRRRQLPHSSAMIYKIQNRQCRQLCRSSLAVTADDTTQHVATRPVCRPNDFLSVCTCVSHSRTAQYLQHSAVHAPSSEQ